METDHFIGLDLGQSQDPTALAIVERVAKRGERNRTTFAQEVESSVRLRYIERLALGTSYPEVVARVGKVMNSPLLGESRKHLVVDATGVGRPVVDLLERAELPAKILPVTITGGAAEGMTGGSHRVPKRDLIVGLQVMLQEGTLEIARGLKDGQALMKELADMRVQVTSAGREKYGAKSGSHDDLVIAVALAVWGVRWSGSRGRAGLCGAGRVV